MIKFLALKMSRYYSDKSIIQHEKQVAYAYGFELLISTALNLACVLLISCLCREFPIALLFVAAFIPLRLAAGGYHAKHHWSCILGFNAIFLLFVVLIQRMNPHHFLLYSFISNVISTALVWSFAPVEAANKPLSDHQHRKQKKHSIVISCINLVIAFPSFFLTQPFDRWLAYYSSGALSAGLLLIVAKIRTAHTRSQAY